MCCAHQATMCQRRFAALLQGPPNVDAIAALVELGARPAAAAEHTGLEPPLHVAARCGRVDALTRLLRAGVDINCRAKVRSFPNPSECRLQRNINACVGGACAAA